MFYYSLGIQEAIQQVVNKVSIILTNKGTSVPYLENACCNEGSINTYDYFVDGNNLIEKLRNKEPLFAGIIGYEETVIPQIQNAVLSGQDIVLLGERGQAKSRLIRALVELLDEEIPFIKGCEINDDPFKSKSHRINV